MSQHLIVQKISPEVEAQLSELSHQKSVLAQIGPRIIRDYSTTINGRVYIHVAGATLVAAVFGFSVRSDPTSASKSMASAAGRRYVRSPATAYPSAGGRG